MMRKLTIIVFTVVLGANCLAQDGLVIRANGRQELPADAKKIYFWACSAVEREFRISRLLRPQVTLAIGGDQDAVHWDAKEIRLTKWDPYLFAQGVVLSLLRTSCHKESGWPWQNALSLGPIRPWKVRISPNSRDRLRGAG